MFGRKSYDERLIRASKAQLDAWHDEAEATRRGYDWHAKSREHRERQLPVEIVPERVIRLKVGDRCGNTCWFCHNEGTLVLGSQADRGIASQRRSLVTIASPGEQQLAAGDVLADGEFQGMLEWCRDELDMDELHLTGGEPTLHKQIVGIVDIGTRAGMDVKMTSNGELGSLRIPELAAAGLKSINFSIYGLEEGEFLRTQHKDFPAGIARRRIAKLREAMATALDCGLMTKANLVVTPNDGYMRLAGALEELDPRIDIRLQPELKDQARGLMQIREFLTDYGGKPVRRVMHTGSSNEYVQYDLTDIGRIVTVKYFRRSRLPSESACTGCPIDAAGNCHEGYYGLRAYRDTQLGAYTMGVCMERMDLRQPFDEFREQYQRLGAASLAGLVRDQPFHDAITTVTNPDVLTPGHKSRANFVWPTYEQDAERAKRKSK